MVTKGFLCAAPSVRHFLLRKHGPDPSPLFDDAKISKAPGPASPLSQDADDSEDLIALQDKK